MCIQVIYAQALLSPQSSREVVHAVTQREEADSPDAVTKMERKEQNINKEARECGFQLSHLQRFWKSVPRRCFPQPSKRTCFLTGPRFSGQRGKDSVRSEHSWQDEAANEVFGEIMLCDRKRNKENPIPVPLKELKMLSLWAHPLWLPKP